MKEKNKIAPGCQENPQIPERLTEVAADSFELEDEMTIFESLVADLQLTGASVDKSVFDRSRFRKVDFSESRLIRLAGLDTVFEDCNFANAKLQEPSLRRVTISNSKLMGLQVVKGLFRDATFSDSRIDFSQLKSMRLKQVTFINCTLRDIEFHDVQFDSVCFVDCDLSRASFTQTSFESSLFRNCTLNEIKGVSNLRGATIEATDLFQIVDILAAELGIQIIERSG